MLKNSGPVNEGVLAPDDAGGHYLKGQLHEARSELGPAIQAYHRALQLDPNNADAWSALGAGLGRAGQLVSAIDAQRRALALVPDHPAASRHLRSALAETGPGAARPRDAAGLALIRQADELGRAATRHYNAGEARRALDLAHDGLQLAPDGAGLRFVAACAAADLGMKSLAFSHYDHLARLPDSVSEAMYRALALAWAAGSADRAGSYAAALLGREKNRGNLAFLRRARALTLPAIQDSRASIAESRMRYGQALEELLAERVRLPDTSAVRALSSFFLAYHGENDRELQRKAAQLYSQCIPALNYTAAHCRGRPRRPGRIRVGLVSHFFHRHSIGKTSRGLIDRFDRKRFEVFVIRIVPGQKDELTAAIQGAAEHFVEVEWGPSPGAAHSRMAALELDVLFYQDIGMEPVSYFLALSRLAPVQCVSFGHPDTTGIATMDYFVSNDLYETAESSGHYSEELFQLHDLPTLAYYYRPPAPARARSRAELGLPAAGALYLCPQALFKMHPDFDEMLRGILERDPTGHVVLISGRFGQWFDTLKGRFARSLGELGERIIPLEPRYGVPFMELLAGCDVMLDTPHFNGMNSSLEAFSVGLPIVTLPTQFQRGRHTRAMYLKMGIEDCIASDARAYVDIAVRLGTDPDFNHDARRRIKARSAVLYEDRRVVREFERFFDTALAARGIGV